LKSWLDHRVSEDESPFPSFERIPSRVAHRLPDVGGNGMGTLKFANVLNRELIEKDAHFSQHPNRLDAPLN
jgi:hypothetical protein